MSNQSEITRLANVCTNIRNAIVAKGVAVPSGAKIDQMPSYVSVIPTGAKCYEVLHYHDSETVYRPIVGFYNSDQAGGYADLAIYFPDAAFDAVGNNGYFNIVGYNTSKSGTDGEKADLSVLAKLSSTAGGIYETEIYGYCQNALTTYSYEDSETGETEYFDVEGNALEGYSITKNIYTEAGISYGFIQILMRHDHPDITDDFEFATFLDMDATHFRFYLIPITVS